MRFQLLSVIMLLFSVSSIAVESSIKGIVDLRFHYVDSDAQNDSYLNGDYGKFRFNDGAGFSLGQLGIKHQLAFENNWSSTLVLNAFSEHGHIALGITEAYLSYKGLPSANGWRINAKAGVFYPGISVENIATSWSTPYTITSSTLNNWIGEELRNTGVEISLDKLGKFTQSDHSFSIDAAIFQNNDPAGAMITWHGWTLGSRQTLLQEKLKVQDFPARQGMLSKQAAYSDPFVELDDRFGAHIAASWQFKHRFNVSAGYYDNHAQEGVVKQGQYTWTTEFAHFSVKAKLGKGTELLGQYMTGSTYMTSPFKMRVVDNDFENGFIMLRHYWDEHHLAARIEAFEVDDLDSLVGDNNHESGRAITTAYRYQLNRRSFVLAEFNWVSSHRPSRYYYHQPRQLVERQYQLAYRYYF